MLFKLECLPKEMVVKIQRKDTIENGRSYADQLVGDVQEGNEDWDVWSSTF